MNEETKPGNRNPLWALGALAVVVGLGILLMNHLSRAATSEVSGQLTIAGEAWAPRHCRSGKIEDDGPHDLARFHGIDLLGAGTRTVRVLEDPTDGTKVVVRDEAGAARPIVRDDCSRFEVELRETEEAIHSVWGFDGSIALDCGDVQGEVTFTSCYGGH